MAKIAKPTERPACNSGLNGRWEAAPQIVVKRKRRDSSAPFAVSAPVKFMELRPSMCRWPIGDPQHHETFRFCGSACASDASYCKRHNAIAHGSNRLATPRKTNFQVRPPPKVA